ncbi:hypothetical protein [Actinacidiphila acidipaludis]|uniref:Uncharacterized protein n=1 Tax=Actinacidiphila acidipaludis TaxID=2873382 RepID=A0ABS7Q9B5_9ACTN|nr:hypothetical protein [Streptomyces acidipaludis]MBY8879757.1 hypothetical protein [Streptomyces acidipaludis]
MTTNENPRVSTPGASTNDSDQHAVTSVAPSTLDAAMDNLHGLTDDQLQRLADDIGKALDGHMREVLSGGAEDAVSLAACARLILRRRRSAAAQARAAQIVKSLADYGRGA